MVDIYIDADACPVKDETVRVASRHGLKTYLVSDGGVSPYRCKVRPPSLINLTLLREMLIGWKMADLFVTFGTIDINMGEVDR